MPSERRELSKAFRTLRKKLMLTQTEFAKLLGTSRPTIARVEAGKVIPIYRTLRTFRALQAKHARKAAEVW